METFTNKPLHSKNRNNECMFQFIYYLQLEAIHTWIAWVITYQIKLILHVDSWFQLSVAMIMGEWASKAASFTLSGTVLFTSSTTNK